MKDIQRRIEKLEAKLGIGEESEPHVMIIPMVYKGGKYITLPEDAREWVTYQEKVADGSTIIILTADFELEARKKAGRTDLDLVGCIKRISTETGGK